MFNFKKFFQLKEQKERMILGGSIFENDDSWHNGFYPWVIQDKNKQLKYDQIKIGEKYIYVDCQPSPSGCGGITMYKSVVILKKWKTTFLFFHPKHVRIKATWNGKEDDYTLAWHGGGHVFPWRDIDAGR